MARENGDANRPTCLQVEQPQASGTFRLLVGTQARWNTRHVRTDRAKRAEDFAMRAQKRETKRTHISQVRHLRGTGAVCRRVRWNTSPLAGTQAPPGTQARCRKSRKSSALWNTSPLEHKPLWNTRHVHTDLAPWTLKRRARARKRAQNEQFCFG